MAAPTPEQIKELFDVHNSPESTAARQFRADLFDPRRRWAKKDGYYRLSDRLWQGKQDIRRQINEILLEAIRTGEDALIVAEKLEQFLDPDYAPVRLKSGKYKPGQKNAIITRAPGRGGMGSFPARRLARTEITRVHGAATIWTAQHTPFATGVKWRLSGRHPLADECNEIATKNSGLGPGVYPADDVPRYPAHPQDLCTLSVETEPDVDKIVAALKKEYGL